MYAYLVGLSILLSCWTIGHIIKESFDLLLNLIVTLQWKPGRRENLIVTITQGKSAKSNRRCFVRYLWWFRMELYLFFYSPIFYIYNIMIIEYRSVTFPYSSFSNSVVFFFFCKVCSQFFYKHILKGQTYRRWPDISCKTK